MKKLMIILALIPYLLTAQVIISSDEQLSNISFTSGETYQIAGTLTTTGTINIENVNDITITGPGEVIANFSGDNLPAVFRVAQCDNIQFRNLKITGSIEQSPMAARAVRLRPMY